jgi:hypothetical protein
MGLGGVFSLKNHIKLRIQQHSEVVVFNGKSANKLLK